MTSDGIRYVVCGSRQERWQEWDRFKLFLNLKIVIAVEFASIGCNNFAMHYFTPNDIALGQ